MSPSSRKLQITASAAFASAMASTQLPAAIVHVSGTTFERTFTNLPDDGTAMTATVQLDVDGGGNDFILRVNGNHSDYTNGSSTYQSQFAQARIEVAGTTFNASNFLSNRRFYSNGLSVGKAISTIDYQTGSIGVGAYGLPLKSDSVSGFFGFVVNGKPGWIRYSISADFDANRSTIVFSDYAYETEGNRILTGDTGGAESGSAVPEPSSAALMSLGLLAAGACGVREFRRRKKEASQEVAINSK